MSSVYLRLIGLISLFLLPAFAGVATSQSYFPPKSDTTWETVSFSELGWCEQHLDTLVKYLSDNHTRGFIVLKDGRIAIEWYPDSLTKSSLWYWASAGKSLTSTLVGIAQEQGKLALTDVSSTYLGKGWTSLSDEQEDKITVWHQLTMTSGLDDGVGDPHCTLPECLVYKADPGTRWAYHNAPYTLLDGVIQSATGSTLNAFLTEVMKKPTGMDGLYVKSGYRNVMYSTPRSMARFGLLALNNFVWDGTVVLGDAKYIYDMTHPSQQLNKSYGYLWWLNGYASYMIPGLQIQFPGPLAPNEPSDAVNALGKDDQILCVVPSERLVVVRMGENATAGGPDVTTVFMDGMWKLLRNVICTQVSVHEGASFDETQHVELSALPHGTSVVLVSTTGECKPLSAVPENLNIQLLGDLHVIATSVVDGVADAPPIVYLLVPTLP